MRAEVTRTVSIPEAARLAKRDRTSMFRLLMRLAEGDMQAHGKCDWMIRTGPKRKIMLNLSRLEVAHPALFRRKYVDREEYETLVATVSSHDDELAQQRSRLKAIAAGVREAKADIKRLQSVADRCRD